MADEATGRLLGAVVYWSLDDVTTPRDELRRQFATLGLGGAFGKVPKPTSLLARAIRKRKVRPGVQFRQLSRRAWEVCATATIGTVRRTELMVSWHDGVHIEPRGAVLSIDEDVAAEAESVRITTMLLLSEADAVELSEMLVASVLGTESSAGMLGVNLRGPTGGVYLVPPNEIERARALAFLLGDLCCGEVTVLSIQGSENADSIRSQVGMVIRRSLGDLVGEYQDFVASGRKPNRASARGRLARLERLSAQVFAFTELLGSDAGVLSERVGSLEPDMRKALAT